MLESRRKKTMWAILIAVLALLGGGLLISTDPRVATVRQELQTQASQALSRLAGRTKLETALQETQTAYAAEQAKTKTLAQTVDELSKAVERAEARAKTLEENYRTSEQEKETLHEKETKLETALRELQAAYTAEQQAASKKLTQKAEDLLKAWEQAQPRLKGLEERQKVCEQERGKLETKGTKLEVTLQEVRTAYAAEQTKSKGLTEKADELSKALEQAHARAKTLEDWQTDLVALHYAIGNGYSKRGMHGEALRAFQTALKLDPNHAESNLELARIYLEQLNNREAALPYLQRYVQLKPEAQDTERIKGWLMKFEKELKAKRFAQ